MKLFLFVAMLMAMTLVACSGIKTTRLTFNGGELLYTDSVTAEQAKALGDYLVKTGFFDGRMKTVQVDKKDGVVHFAMVLNDSLAKSAEYQTAGMVFVRELEENVFKGQTVEVDYCDDRLNVLKNIKGGTSAAVKEGDDETATLQGGWICSHISGGENSAEKTAADLEVLRKNFTFTFNDDSSFESDFINGQDVSQPLHVTGFYTVVKDKISMHGLKINSQPANEEMVFNFGLNNKGLQLVSHTDGANDLVMTFERK